MPHQSEVNYIICMIFIFVLKKTTLVLFDSNGSFEGYQQEGTEHGEEACNTKQQRLVALAENEYGRRRQRRDHLG
jgi:hypothetical protein